MASESNFMERLQDLKISCLSCYPVKYLKFVESVRFRLHYGKAFIGRVSKGVCLSVLSFFWQE